MHGDSSRNGGSSGAFWSWLFVVALTVLAAARGARTQASPSEPSSALREDAPLRDVFFLSPELGWAVGDRGVIWSTCDGGRSWQAQRSGVDCRLESIHFIDEARGWAVGGRGLPFIHATQGVLLRTSDGGRSWRSIPQTLPALKQVRFVDAEHGYCLGESSGLFPTGVYLTEDGGHSWKPLPGAAAQGWLAGRLLDPLNGALAGRRGALAVLRGGQWQPSRMPPVGLRAFTRMEMTPLPSGAPLGWLVGEGGLVLQSLDGGMSWQLPPQNIPEALRDGFDFYALAVRGSHCWVAGSPGTLVLHSPDHGRSWNAYSTGQVLPIRSLSFIDETRGWAVGELGTILATSDGGKTWRRQHSGGTRAAVLACFGDAASIPWEVLVQLGGNDGYLCAAEIIGREDADAGPSTAATLADRAHEAAIRSGGVGAHTAWQFPLRQKGLSLATEHIVQGWNLAHDGRGLSRLEEHLVRQIRIWRPEVVVTHAATSQAAAPLAHVVNQQVQNAVAAAADGTRFPQQLAQEGLSAWQVKKVVGVLPSGERGAFSINTSQLALRLGKSLAEAAADARGLVQTRDAAAPATVELRVSQSVLSQQVALVDFMSGIRLHPGGEARRLLDQPLDDLEGLQKAAQKYRNTRAILERAQKNSPDLHKLSGQLGDLTADLAPASAARVLYEVAQQQHLQGRSELAAETLQLLLDRYPQDPLVTSALVWLVQYYASGELAWRARREQRHVVAQLGGQNAPAVVRAANSLGGQGTVTLLGGEGERSRRAVELGKRLERIWPAVHGEPQVRFPLAVAQITQGFPRDAERFYFSARTGRPRDAWWSCAMAEIWLQQRRDEPPKPVTWCKRSPTKPYLDGRFDEPIWKSAQPVELQSALGDDAQWPATAYIARDDEYLYFAVQCQQAPGADYRTTSGPRPRDPDLEAYDRVDFCIDIDRDYATYYRLSIDSRGWAADSCFADKSWDPTWFVAAKTKDGVWTAEAAIPLAELTSKPPDGKVTWAVGIQRTVPNVGFQSWSRPAATSVQPEGFGLLLLDEPRTGGEER